MARADAMAPDAPVRTAGSRPALSPSSGVTLVELLTVLAIFAGVAALASPWLSRSFGGQQVNAAAREVASALRRARALAIGRQEETVVVIDVTDRTYAFDSEFVKLVLPEDAALVLTTARSERLGDHRGGIRFFPDGSSTGGTVAVRSDTATRTIEIDWLTGQGAVST